MILRRRGIAPKVLPPVSLVLATWAGEYVDALTGTRYLGLPDSEAAVEGVNRWVELFAAASKRAVVDATTLEERIAEIQTLGPIGSTRSAGARRSIFLFGHSPEPRP